MFDARLTGIRDGNVPTISHEELLADAALQIRIFFMIVDWVTWIFSAARLKFNSLEQPLIS